MKKEYVTARLLFKKRNIDNELITTHEELHHSDHQETSEIKNNLEENCQIGKSDEVPVESSLLSKCLNIVRKVLKALGSIN
jgi:hypothetical protein